MILENFVYQQFQKQLAKDRAKKLKEGYDGADGFVRAGSVAAIFIFIIWLFLIFMWIYTIVVAAKCPDNDASKVGGIIVAIFFWPAFWIVKWSGGFCQK